MGEHGGFGTFCGIGWHLNSYTKWYSWMLVSSFVLHNPYYTESLNGEAIWKSL